LVSKSKENSLSSEERKDKGHILILDQEIRSVMGISQGWVQLNGDSVKYREGKLNQEPKREWNRAWNR